MKSLLKIVSQTAVLLAATSVQAEQLIGVGNFGPFRFIIGFDSESPLFPNYVQWINGVPWGEQIVSLDARPSDGAVFVLSTTPGVSDSASNIYRLELTSGKATPVIGPLNPPLEKVNATNFGMDFSPVNERIRIVSDTNQNVAVNIATGTVSSNTDAAYAVLDSNFGADPNITHIAFNNNVKDAGFTTLFAIDTELGVLARMGQVSGELITVGELGINTDEVGGFDITSSGGAFALIAPNGFQQLHRIDLATGAAETVGVAALGFLNLQGITGVEFPLARAGE